MMIVERFMTHVGGRDGTCASAAVARKARPFISTEARMTRRPTERRAKTFELENQVGFGFFWWGGRPWRGPLQLAAYSTQKAAKAARVAIRA